jgi:hypothetical protein
MTNSNNKNKGSRHHRTKSRHTAGGEAYPDKKKKSDNDLSSSSPSSLSSLPPIHLILGVFLSLLTAAIAAWYRQQQVHYHDTNSTTKPTLSQLFRIACQSSNGLVHCNDFLLDIHDTNRTISAKHEHKAGTGLRKGWKLLDIPRNVQIWSEFFWCDPIQNVSLSHFSCSINTEKSMHFHFQ